MTEPDGMTRGMAEMPAFPPPDGFAAPAVHSQDCPGAQDVIPWRSLSADSALGGSNRLLLAAAPLFDLALMLGDGRPQQGDLRRVAIEGIASFNMQVERSQIGPMERRIASYALCSMIDETVLTTEWGSQGEWGRETLVWLFHKESSGGENFFTYLQEMENSPDASRELLEFMSAVLDLGYAGQFHVLHDGAHALETIRMRLHERLRTLRSPQDAEIWVRASDSLRTAPLRPGVWACFAFAVLSVALVYGWLSYRTVQIIEPVQLRVERLAADYGTPIPAN